MENYLPTYKTRLDELADDEKELYNTLFGGSFESDRQAAIERAAFYERMNNTAKAAEQEPAVSGEDRGFMGAAKDIGLSVAAGAANLGGAVVQATDMASRFIDPVGRMTGDMISESAGLPTSGDMLDAGRRVAGEAEDYLSAQKSDYSKAQAQQVANADGFIGTVKAYGENPSQIAEGIAGSLPYMLPIGIAARTARAAGMSAAGVTAATAGAGAVLEGGAAGAQANSEIMEMKAGDLIASSPDYASLIEQGVDPEKAKSIVASRAGLTAQALQMPVSFLASRLSGAAKLESEFFTGSMAKGWINGVSLLAREGAEEIIQEGANQASVNTGVKLFGDQNREVMEGVPEAAASGMVIGAGQAAGMQGTNWAARKLLGGPQQADQNDDDSIDQPANGEQVSGGIAPVEIDRPVLREAGNPSDPNDRFKFELDTDSFVSNLRRRIDERKSAEFAQKLAPQVASAEPEQETTLADVARKFGEENGFIQKPIAYDGGVNFERVPVPVQQPQELSIAPLAQPQGGIDFVAPQVPARTEQLASGIEKAISQNIDKARNSRMPENLKDVRLLRSRYRTHLNDVATGIDSDNENASPDYVMELAEFGSPAEIKKAVTKALSGEKLGARQAIIVQEVLDSTNRFKRDDAAVIEKWEKRARTMLSNKGNRELDQWRNRDEHAADATTEEAALNELMTDATVHHGIEPDSIKSAYDAYAQQYPDSMGKLTDAMVAWVTDNKRNSSEQSNAEQIPIQRSPGELGAPESGAGLSLASQAEETAAAPSRVESGAPAESGSDSAGRDAGLRQPVDLPEGWDKSLIKSRRIAKSLNVPAYNTMRLGALAEAIRAKQSAQTEIDTAAAAQAATSPLNDLPEPTQAQKEAGNYKKAHVKVQGLDIAIENARGSTRSGQDPKGKKWSVDMQHHYGYIKRTEGADGDHVDTFIGPNTESDKVFIVDQVNADGSFDEHKVMLGFDSESGAAEGYKSNYSEGWKVGPITSMSMDEFKDWVKNGETKKPLATALSAPQSNEQKPAKTESLPPISESKQAESESNAVIREQKPEKPESDLPPILTQTKKQFIAGMAKERGLKKDSPGYAAALSKLEDEYAESVDRAQAELPFEKFNELNSDSPESVNRQAYDALREDFGLDGDIKFSLKSSAPQTETPAFKRWFGDSKVVDSQGNPRVMYHGTAASFDEFSKKKATDKEGRKLGFGWGKDKFYFAETGEAASSAAEFAQMTGRGNQMNVMPVYLSIKKPIAADDYRGQVRAEQDAGLARDAAIAKVDKRIKSQGYDGIIDDETGGVAVFDPAQIKSAIGNNGDFDPANPDIRYKKDSDKSVSGSITRDTAQAVIDRISKNWKIDAKVMMAESIGDLPPDVRKRLNEDGKSLNDVQAMYHPKTGNIYLNASSLKSADHVERLVFHEVYAHMGLQNLFGESVTGVMSQLYLAMGGKAGINRIAKERGIDLASYQELYKDSPAGYRNALIAEELLAHLAENPRPRVVQLAKELIGEIKAWLRKNGFAELSKVSDSDIAYLLKQARETVTKGKGGDISGLIYAIAGISKADRKATNKVLRYSLDKLPGKSRKMIEGKGLLELWGLLAQSDEAFSYPASDSTNIEEVFETVGGPEGITLVRQDFADRLGRKQWAIMRNDEDTGMFVIEKGDDVYLNVALGGPGEGGSAIYAAAGNYAHNAGKVFIGDPNGLSDEAVSRRLENMISLALKFGSTEFLRPHPRQVKGAAGVDAVSWIEGDDSHNLRSMIMASYKNVLKQMPEIENYRYDIDRDTLVDEAGDEINPREFSEIGNLIRGQAVAEGRREGVPRRAGIPYTTGGRSNQRALLTHTFLRGTSGEKSELLDRVRQGLPESSSLNRVLYSLSPSGFLFGGSKTPRGATLPHQLKDAYSQLGGANKTLFEKVKTEVRRQLAPRGLLPTEIFDLKIARDGAMNADDSQQHFILKDFYAQVQEVYKKPYHELRRGTRKEINDYLKGDRTNVQLTDSMIEVLARMRTQIQSLSKSYMDQLLLDAANLEADGKIEAAAAKRALIETITDNFDNYLHRSYRAFDDKDWPKKVPEDVYQNAVNFLAKQYAKDAHIKGYVASRKAERKAATSKAKREAFERKYYENHAQIKIAREEFELAKTELAEAKKRLSLSDIAGNRVAYRASSNEVDKLVLTLRAKNKALLAVKREGAAMARQKERDSITGSITPTADHITKATKKVDLILHEGTAYDSMGRFISESKLGSKDLSVIKKRKQISPEIRALLGEYEDPAINYAKSVTKMTRLVHNTSFLRQMTDISLQLGYIFEEENRPVGANKKIAADASEVYAPLNGMYTYPEFEQALRDAVGSSKEPDWYKVLVVANGAVKYGKTVLAPTTAVRNFLSASMFSLTSGHWDVRHLEKSIRSAKTYLTGKDVRGSREYINHLLKLGVLYDSPNYRELQDLIKSVNESEHWLAKATRKSKMGAALNYAQEFYAMGDDFWKILGFENEKAMLIKHYKMSEAAAEKEAAERIRNTYPTYSLTGKGIQTLRRFPVIGSFPSFPAEIIRTTFHKFRYFHKDAKALGYTNPSVLAKGVGLALGAGLMSGLSALSAAVLGVDDDEEEAIRQMLPEWSRNSSLFFLGRDDKGQVQYMDLGWLDPYGYWKKPIAALARDADTTDKLGDAAWEALSPFLGLDIAVGTTGQFVYDSFFNDSITTEKATEKLTKGLSPGFVNNIMGFWEASNETVTKSGKRYTYEDEALALIGFRKGTLNTKVGLTYQAYGYADKKRQAATVLREKATDLGKVDIDELRSAYEKSMGMQRDAWDDMRRTVKMAMKTGMTQSEAVAALRTSGMSLRDARGIVTDNEFVYRPSKTMMKLAIKRTGILFDQEAQAELIERQKRLNELQREYMEKPVR